MRRHAVEERLQMFNRCGNYFHNNPIAPSHTITFEDFGELTNYCIQSTTRLPIAGQTNNSSNGKADLRGIYFSMIACDNASILHSPHALRYRWRRESYALP